MAAGTVRTQGRVAAGDEFSRLRAYNVIVGLILVAQVVVLLLLGAELVGVAKSLRRALRRRARSPRPKLSGAWAEVLDRLRERGVRVEVDESDDRMQKKIRNAQLQKVPFMVIAGDQDMEAGAVSFRYRDGRQDNGVPIDEAIERVAAAVASREQV